MSLHPLLLDGGTATGLQAAGIPMLEPWLTSASLRNATGRNTLIGVHAEFLNSGSDIVTANTFRTNTRALARMGVPDEAHASYVRRAVTCAATARQVAGKSHALVAASVAPVEDCYTPALTPERGTLRREHRWMATVLADAGVDLVLVETQCTRREAVIAVEASHLQGLRTWVSFVVTDQAALPGGESLRDAARACVDVGASAVSVNCLPPSAVPVALEHLAGLGVPVGAYPNLENRAALAQWEHSERALTSALSPEAFASLVRGWDVEFGLGFVGGCCGTEPDHIRALADRSQDVTASS
jgi:S-methylmethionine-dependent homocysteine/selenocysteine methylase